MKRVSIPAGVSVSGEVAASRGRKGGRATGSVKPGANRGATLQRSLEPRQAKDPKPSQFVQMAGAMNSAIDHLRVFYETLDRAVYISGDDVLTVHKIEATAMLAEVLASVNILRAGLKARASR